jgi:hypothetical protein
MSALTSLPFSSGIRRRLRAKFFDTLRAAVATDDGRAALAGRLEDSLAWRPSAVASFSTIAAPFDDLKHTPPPRPESVRPVFITARFRTGSTLLWNVFRHLEGCTAFYEPFNERRWFDPSHRGSRVDTTHRAVADYWREYDGLSELAGYYQEDWIRRRLYMDEQSWDPDMAAYIRVLITRAPARPVLQFNRVDFRLAWLRRTFPEATLVHLYRHPRDQWCSTFPDPAEFPNTAPAGAFAAHDHFYLREWAEDLKYRFPFLDERRVAHPYRLFYLIWRLSYCFGVTQADHSLSFEDLVAEPSVTLSRLFDAVGIERTTVPAVAPLITPTASRWRQYADDAWFRAHEDSCEELLREFWGTPSGAAPALARAPLRLAQRGQA